MKKIFGKSKNKESNGNGLADDDEEMEELAASNDRKGIKLVRSPDSGFTSRSPTSDQISVMSIYDRKRGRCSSQGRTELHKAARKGHVDRVITELANIRLSTVDDDGCTPLHDAAASDEGTAEEVMEILLKQADASSCVNRRNVDGLTALHIAASGGREKLVIALIDRGAKIDDCNNPGKNTPLHLAAACPDRSKSAAVVAAICAHDDHINKTNAAGRTPLHLAAGVGNTEAVKTLLLHGARRSAKDNDGMTAVHAAAACEDEKSAEDIITQLCVKDQKDGEANEKKKKVTKNSTKSRAENKKKVSKKSKSRQSDDLSDDDVDDDDDDDGSDDDDDEVELINRRSYSRKTALHVAAGLGRVKTVKTLLKNGARRNIVNDNGRTALHYFAFKYREDPYDNSMNSAQIVYTLCKASPVDEEDRSLEFVNHGDKAGQTALHLAAQYGQQKTIKALIDCKASVSGSLDSKGYTPIMSAAFSKESPQLAEIVGLLCSVMRTTDAINSHSLKSRWTALHATAFNGQLSAVKTLLDHGAKIEVKNKDDNCPIHVALLAHNTNNAAKIVETMIGSKRSASEKESLVNEPGDKKKTLLHLAAGKGLFDVVGILLEAGAKLTVVDDDKWTPLHEACAAHEDNSMTSANVMIIRKFCELMAPTDPEFLNRQNALGETALHMAARFGHTKAAKTLLDYGARYDVKDNDGWLALHSSIQGGLPEIAAAIVEAIKTSKEKQQQQQQQQKVG